MKLKKQSLVAVALLVSALSYARPTNSVLTIYYLDESHTTVVGEKFFTCNAQTIMDGEVTPYYEVRIGGKC